MKFVFFGTPEFAAIVLEKLIAAGYVPAAVICNPDELVGRKQILTPPPAKVLAEKHGISVFQPEKLRSNLEFLEQFKNLKPDLAIVAAYGKILPKEVLNISSRGFINVHGSLLPYYRGASPIQTAILNGDKETGITIMKIDEEMDHGAVLVSEKVGISAGDTYESLSARMAEAGAELLIKIIPDFLTGKIEPVPQEHDKATYTKIIKKENGKIDWQKPAEEIERMVRAFHLWPNAWTEWNGKNLKILEAEVADADGHESRLPADRQGEIFLYNDIATVKCSAGVLIIKKLQLEGGRALAIEEFLNGHKDFVGSVLN